MLRLVVRNLTKHKLRSLLTVGSLVVALFLLCILRTLVTTLEAGTQAAKSNRLWVQSAVSLFVDLPLAYEAKIDAVEGVEKTCKVQWFGAYYQNEDSFFGQFAVDGDTFLDMYPEVVIVAGSRAGFLANRIGCLVGKALAKKYKWEIGDRIPLIAALFQKDDGSAWDFELEGIYEVTEPVWDDRTFFFHWDYFEKTMEATTTGQPDVGTFVVQTRQGADQVPVMAAIDQLFEHGPQRVQSTTEADFQAQFVSMMGNIPFFVAAIGGGVLLAIFLACVNTMIMAAREQTRDIGIMKALGFTDRSMFGLLTLQSMTLCVTGGLLGIGLALLAEPWIAHGMGSFFPGFAITAGTRDLGIALTLGIGVLAGIVPAWQASRLRCVEALRSME